MALTSSVYKARISGNWIVKRLARLYVSIFQRHAKSKELRYSKARQCVLQHFFFPKETLESLECLVKTAIASVQIQNFKFSLLICKMGFLTILDRVLFCVLVLNENII